MKVMLYFSAQFCGSGEVEVDIPDDSTDEYIESLFEEEMGLKFDHNCWYNRINEN
jgi:hypothetical protein